MVYSVGAGVLDDPAAFRRRKPPRGCGQAALQSPFPVVRRAGCPHPAAGSCGRPFSFFTPASTPAPARSYPSRNPRRRTRARAPAAGPGQPDGTGAAGRAISQDRALKKSASGRPRPWAASRAASALPRDTAHTDHHTPPGVPSPAAARPRYGSWRTARWPSAAPTAEKCRSCV